MTSVFNNRLLIFICTIKPREFNLDSALEGRASSSFPEPEGKVNYLRSIFQLNAK